MRLQKSKARDLIARASGVALSFALVAGAVISQFAPAQAAALNKKYEYIDTNYAVPASNVLWVAPDGSNSNSGTEDAPLATIKQALSKATDGTTIVVKSGIYREPHFFVTKNNITIQSAPHAEVWLKGSEVVSSSSWTKEGDLWKSTGNYQNFCHVCTTNKNPDVEGVAAFPEQVFIDDEALEQVASKDQVTAGKFYVEDNTPTTLKVANDNTQGYNIGAQDEITYYVGSDPTTGTTEVSQRSRAFSVAGTVTGFKMKAINVAQYSPVQVWNFNDPTMSGIAGPMAVTVNGEGSLVENSIFAQNSVVGFNLDGAANSTVTGNKFVDNGANGAGANRSHGTTLEKNTFANNNAAGFETRGSYCTSYCTVSHVKVTHTENFTFHDNIIDDSNLGRTSSDPDNVRLYQTTGFWCDEGCIDAKIVRNFFTNVPHAIFYEVSDSGIIASNIIESGGRGIGISGSSNVKIYNNTISRTALPIVLREDNRIDGCNSYNSATKTCTTAESWSQGKGLSWDLTGLEMYNNIISSRAYTSNDSSGPYWYYPVRIEGAVNQDGTTVYANDMFEGFDYNVYYRSDASSEPYMFTWDLKDVADPINIMFTQASEISQDSRVDSSIEGREANAYDTFGSRADNPYFIKEATNNTDYKQSNYALKSTSTANNSGVSLPADVALAIDPTGSVIQSGVAVNRGALLNVLMDATNGAATDDTIVDLTELEKAIADAEAEPSYIQQDSDVASALATAKTTVEANAPTVDEVEAATDALNRAVAAAKQKEADAQAAAEAALVQAESDKTESSVEAAQKLIDKIGNQTVKANLQARLDAIVPDKPNSQRTILQQNGKSMTINSSGDACYSISAATANGSYPSTYNSYVLREAAEFTIDCDKSAAATGYKVNIMLTLSALYTDATKLKVFKVSNGEIKNDITDKVTIGASSDGTQTTVSYTLTDGGWGDEDEAANGIVVDPVAIYELQEDNSPTTPDDPTSPTEPEDPVEPTTDDDTSSDESADDAVQIVAANLTETGDGIYAISGGAIALGAAGIYIIVRRR